jgi:hypothetical protein
MRATALSLVLALGACQIDVGDNLHTVGGATDAVIEAYCERYGYCEDMYAHGDNHFDVQACVQVNTDYYCDELDCDDEYDDWDRVENCVEDLEEYDCDYIAFDVPPTCYGVLVH